MGRGMLKAIFPLLLLASILLMLLTESRNAFKQIKEEANINIPQDEQKYEEPLWKPIERRDSYNNELQFYSKDNVVIKGDTVEIISSEEKKEGKMYTSGLVESTSAFKYGYFEFTIGISEGKGIFPAIWFMPVDGDSFPEIGLFEMIGSEPYTFYGVVHFKEDGVRDSDYFAYDVPVKDMYLVALKWTEESLTWYIDNTEVYSTTKGVPREYMYIIINQAIGGDWPGNPDGSTVFPNKFIIYSAHLEPIFKKGRN